MVFAPAIWYHTRVVRRLPVAIAAALLLVFLGQGLAYPARAVVELCSTACADEQPDGTCAPACVDCGCCGHSSRSVLAPEGASEPVVRTARCTAAAPDPRPPAAFAADVFHVPKRPLA